MRQRSPPVLIPDSAYGGTACNYQVPICPFAQTEVSAQAGKGEHGFDFFQ